MLTAFVLSSALWDIDAHASCEVEAKNRNAVIKFHGQAGIWFHIDVAKCLLFDVKQLNLMRDRVSLLEQNNALHESETFDLREAIAKNKFVIGKQNDMLATAANLAHRAAIRNKRHQRQRYIFLALGLVAGSVTVAVLK